MSNEAFGEIGGSKTRSGISQQPVRTDLYLVRHGDALPEEGAADVGPYDALGLSPRGRSQADALARRFHATLEVAAVYSSPALRAYETALRLAAAFGMAVTRDERLREVGLASAEIDGLPALERAGALRAHLKHLAEVALREGTWAGLQGTEPSAGVRERMRACVEALLGAHEFGAIVAVSHAGSINACVAHVLGLQRDFLFPAGNTSLTVIRARGTRRMVARLNDCAHLEAGATWQA